MHQGSVLSPFLFAVVVVVGLNETICGIQYVEGGFLYSCCRQPYVASNSVWT